MLREPSIPPRAVPASSRVGSEVPSSYRSNHLRAGVEKRLLKAEEPRHAHPPRPQDLAADAIAILGLPFEHEHAGSRARHHRGQRTTGDSPANDH
jgi:hypothetical protein